ncbi:MAG: FAD-dependent oxidoreductase [Geobacteraceae bacterium]|nr:FAD-dependent oxidoreductase [Geobacteraceae bacterium]
MLKVRPDIIVAGAGVAGIAAAVAAARRGCSVLLVEKSGMIGGTATGGAVGALCGLFKNGGDSPGELLNVGIVEEIALALLETSSVKKIGKVFTLPYSPKQLLSVLEILCSSESNLQVMLNGSITSVTVNDGVIGVLELAADIGTCNCSPKVLIDATGDGSLSFLAGAGYELSPAGELQMAGFTAALCGIAAGADSLSLKIPFVIAKGIESASIAEFFRYTVYYPGTGATEGFLKISLPDCADSYAVDLPLQAEKLLCFLAGQLTELENASIATTSKRLFSREGRRIKGGYRLSAEDVLFGRKFPDAAVKGAWPMEIWTPGRGVSYRYPPDGDYYEIPAACLKADGFKNMLLAGRCISVTHEALASTRVIGICAALGEQAGLEAVKMII